MVSASPMTRPEQNALVSVAGLEKSFDGFRAVGGISFQIFPGEVFGLLGPNGAGKTTLLRMLAGVLKPSYGRAFVCGHDVVEDSRQAKRALGFLSGETALYERLSAHETLAYFGSLRGIKPQRLKEEIARLSEQFGLGEFLDTRIGALSTGQRQRANLARAFLGDPKVLVLDEPTSGLDVISGQFVYEAILKAKKDGRAVLFSTHVMSEASLLCDRIGLLVHGDLKRIGSESELVDDENDNLASLVVALHKQSDDTTRNGG